MKRYLYILIPLLFFINSAVGNHLVTNAILSPIDFTEQGAQVSGESIEVFSDELMLSRKVSQERIQKFIPATANPFFHQLLAFSESGSKLTFTYPYTSFAKQEVCFGLLFLQQLF